VSQSVTQRAMRAGLRRAVDAPDYGPAIRLNRGEVERTEGPCPMRPNVTVRRAKLVVAYAVLWRAGAITDEQREAGDRYLFEVEAAQGARAGMPADCARYGQPLPSWHPKDRQVRALVSLRAARMVLGCERRALLDLLVLGNLSVRQIAERRRCRRGVVVADIQEALEVLAQHWGM
jgi:hypothetical protein